MSSALPCFLASLALLSAIPLGGSARAAEPDDGALAPAPPGPPPGDVAGRAWAFELDQPIAAGLHGVPPDLHLVTETYAGDQIVRDGALTTYRTMTASQTPGTYARALDTVATGMPSAYDGAAFNGRATLSDGRAVAGTYYETFLPTDEGLVPVSVVFFQDDSEPASGAAGEPVGTSGVAGVSLARGGPYVRRIEVLRGRVVSLWFGAAAGVTPSAVRRWRVVSVDGAVVGATAGSAADPLVARWDRLAPPGAAWRVVVTLTLGDGPDAVVAVAMVDVVVRSPALVE